MLRSHTRKRRRRAHSEPLQLQYLPKRGGGRIESLASYRVVCGAEAVHATLIATDSLKSPEEADTFVHVLRALHAGTHLVVKVQTIGRMMAMELAIHQRLKEHPNIVRYVCDFRCKFNPIVWNTALRAPRALCDTEGNEHHVIVMEYIEHDLATVLETMTLSDEVFLSIVQQVCAALLEFHTRHGISHNDINRGNILLDIAHPSTTPTGTIIYSIPDTAPIRVATYGYTVVFIDFQRGSFAEDTADSLQSASDEISLAYEMLSKWSRRNFRRMEYLEECMRRTMAATTLSRMLDIIANPM